MKTHVKCGLLTALGWNVLLLIAFLIRARFKEVSVSYFFDDGIGGWGITALLIVWSLIWYVIGYVREPLSCTDFTVIGPLMVLSVLCFWYYKKYRLA